MNWVTATVRSSAGPASTSKVYGLALRTGGHELRDPVRELT
ncbi:hypothetical protein [Streptomyces sp. NPDC057199]